jgi:hypothetical protein
MPRMIRSVDQAIAVKEAHPEIVRQRLSVENSQPIRLIPERSPEHFVAGEFEVTIVNVSGCGTWASAQQSPAAVLPLSRSVSSASCHYSFVKNVPESADGSKLAWPGMPPHVQSPA